MKESYTKLAQKHQLPAFEEIAFFVQDLDKDKLSLREIIKSIHDKIDDYSKHVESIIQPETNIISMHELSTFSSDHRKELFKMFKSMMYLSREINRVQISDSEKDNIKLINTAVKEWRVYQPVIEGLFVELRDSWKKETDQSIEEMYFG